MKWTSLGLAVGMVLGLGVTVQAQAVVNAKVDAANAVCWDQPAASLAAANAIGQVQVVYDAAAPVAVLKTCSGATSPYTCNLTTPIPMSVQTVGLHTFTVTGANPNPDGTWSPRATLVTFQANLWIGSPPPTTGGNGRIIKLLQALARVFAGLFSWIA